MDPKQMIKQMFDFNKTAVDKTFAAMAVMQDQTEKMFNLWLDQNKWYPEEGKKAMSDWVKTFKTSRDEFKSKMDEGYKKIEEYMAGLEK
jgi:polyhydroxyalkanoate synthesis regulator phasin